MARDSLGALAFLWCMQQALILFFGQLATRFDQFQALLVASTVLTGTWAPIFCAALVARIYANTYAVFPNAWESLYWCAQTDIALLSSMVLQMRRSSTLFIFPDQVSVRRFFCSSLLLLSSDSDSPSDPRVTSAPTPPPTPAAS